MPRTAKGCASRRSGKKGTNNPKKAAARDEAAAAAAAAAAQAAADAELLPEPEPVVPEAKPVSERACQTHLTPHEERLRRCAIEFEYIQLDSPPEEMWGRGKGGHRGTVRERLREECAKNHNGRQAMTSAIDWADHVVSEGNRLFADTPFAESWVIYHDALTQWWEPDTQAHLLSLGFPRSRQMCCQGDVNKGTRYEGKLVGDTPECMPLDANLFSDYSVSMSHHIAATWDGTSLQLAE